MADRSVCSVCSIPGFNATSDDHNYNVKVFRGEGNCTNCVSARAEAERLSGGFGSKDGTSAGDHDEPYTFGRTKAYLEVLPPWTRARLLVLRGKIQDRRIASHIQAPDQDGL